MNPLFYVALFALLGSWILIDPMPGYILLNFPEFIGRIAIIIYYHIVTLRPVVEVLVRVAPRWSVIYYFDLISEMEDMASTPLGGGEYEDEEDDDLY